MVHRKQRFLFKVCLNSLAISDLIFVVLTSTVFISKLTSTAPALWVRIFHNLLNLTFLKNLTKLLQALGSYTCFVARFLQTVVMLVSSIFLVCIAIDRYLSVKTIDKSSIEPTKFMCLISCVLVWVFAAILSSPVLQMYVYFEVYVVPVPDSRDEDAVLTSYTAFMCARSEVC
jgi:uncharacterized protein with PQ loop repeat